MPADRLSHEAIVGNKRARDPLLLFIPAAAAFPSTSGRSGGPGTHQGENARVFEGFGKRMNEILREGIDFEVAFNSAGRRVEIELVSKAERSSLVRSDVPKSGVGPPVPGFLPRLKNGVLRPVVGLLYRLVRPILRPVAVRLRSFLIDGLREEIVVGQADLALRLGEAKGELARTLEELGELSAGMTDLFAQHRRLQRDIESEEERLADRVQRVQEYAAVAAQQADRVASAAAQQADRVESYAAAAAQRIAIPTRDGNVLVRTNVGYVVCSVDDEALLTILVESGDLEKGTRLLLERFLRPGDVFVDVGANLGLHSLAAARALGGKGRVIAFEPFPPTVQLLERTVYLNGYSGLIEIIPAAVSNQGGTQTLHLGRTSGHHSLYPLVDPIPLPPVEVSVVTLDEQLGPTTEIALIKIDVEGAELDVLDGAQQLLQNNSGIALVVELGLSHLERIGIGLSAWLDAFSSVGFSRWVIDPETGLLEQWSIDRLATEPSVNLFFARDGSKALSRLEL